MLRRAATVGLATYAFALVVTAMPPAFGPPALRAPIDSVQRTLRTFGIVPGSPSSGPATTIAASSARTASASSRATCAASAVLALGIHFLLWVRNPFAYAGWATYLDGPLPYVVRAPGRPPRLRGHVAAPAPWTSRDVVGRAVASVLALGTWRALVLEAFAPLLLWVRATRRFRAWSAVITDGLLAFLFDDRVPATTKG